MNLVGLAAGYFGAALGVSMVIPQILRTLRNRRLPGVSPTSWALTALACLTWMLYGIRTGEAPQIPGNLLMVAGSGLIVVTVPAAVSGPARAVRLAAGASVLAVVAVIAPVDAVGLIAFGIGLVAALPQTIKSLTRRGDGASGVSLLAWMLRGASQLSWLTYALIRHDDVVVIAASVTLVSALLLVLSELRSRPAPPPSELGPAVEQRLVENVQARV